MQPIVQHQHHNCDDLPFFCCEIRWMQWRYWRLRQYLKSLQEADVWKQDDDRRIKILRKSSSTTGEIYKSLKHTIRVLSKSHSILESTDHPLHNVPSQHRRFGNRLTLRNIKKGKSVLCTQVTKLWVALNGSEANLFVCCRDGLYCRCVWVFWCVYHLLLVCLPTATSINIWLMTHRSVAHVVPCIRTTGPHWFKFQSRCHRLQMVCLLPN